MLVDRVMAVGTRRYLATAGGGSPGILILDLVTPPDIIVCLLYPVILVLAPLRGAQLVALATVGAGFTILAGFVEPSLGDPSLVWLNRALVVACLAGCAALLCWPRANDALAQLRHRMTPQRSPVTQFFDSLRRTRAPAPGRLPGHLLGHALDCAAIPGPATTGAARGDLDGPSFVIETMTTLVILDTLAHGAICTVDELCAA